MKVFDRDGKVNFMDDNNVLVGYDMEQCCCENADWFLAEAPIWETDPADTIGGDDFPGYNFDVDYKEPPAPEETLDFEVSIKIFRLTSTKGDLFLHLHNTHNGYYSHGFTVKRNDELLEDGSL